MSEKAIVRQREEEEVVDEQSNAIDEESTAEGKAAGQVYLS